MKKIFVVIAIVLFTLLNYSTVEAAVRVRGYYRSNGTYVAPHYRSDPDSSPYNNWSYPGNTNPYTGETATGNPSTYLKNYENSSVYTPKPIKATPSYTFQGNSYTTYQSYTDAKTKWSAEHKNNIRNLYKTVLNREPYSDDEVNYWYNKENDINKIKDAFYNSDEYKIIQQKKTDELIRKQEEDLKAQESIKSNRSWWQNFWVWAFGE